MRYGIARMRWAKPWAYPLTGDPSRVNKDTDADGDQQRNLVSARDRKPARS
jgi:hypothetical protein